MFLFFLKSYRCGLLTFCGSSVKVSFDINGYDSKFSFRKFENGEIKLHNLSSRHPNILQGVIIGKKSWGLWLNQWTDGIVEWCFTKKEILDQFEVNGIIIPESLLRDFDNTLEKKKQKRNLDYFNSLKNQKNL
jgi:hypothetical protein